MKNIAIIGAGLTGLTTAFYLKKYGFNVCVYEKTDRCGGAMHTLHQDGFSFEAGPTTGVINSPEVFELFEDLNILDKINYADENAKKRLIWKNNSFHPLPSGPISAISTPLFSLKDKIKVLFEPFISKGNNEHENLAHLVKRRLGTSFLNYAIDPFIGGIYAGNPENLIPKYALPKLYNLEQEYGSFIKGAFAKARKKKNDREKKASKKMFSFYGGFSSLINELVANIGEENILTQQKELKIEKQDDKYIINKESYDLIVSACPSTGFKESFAFLNEDEIDKLTNIKYAPVVQIALGFKNWDGIDLNAFGALVPSIEKRNVLGILFTSSFLKDRAPKDSILLSIFMGGTRNEAITKEDDDIILNKAIEEVNSMLKPKNAEINLSHIFRHKYAIPQYEITSKERFQAIKEIENKYSNFFVGGNIHNGIGIGDRIKQGNNIANKIASLNK